MDSQQESEDTKLPKPVDYDQLFPGRFLKAGLFKGKNVTLTVVAVDVEKLPQDKGGDRVRGILSFKETDMQLVLNKTNGICVRAMFDRKPQDWVGKRITFAPEKDKFGREVVDAIRVVGSPDIAGSIDVEIRMPKKKPKKRTLTKTDMSKKQGAAPTAPTPPPEDPDDPGPEPPPGFGDDPEPGSDG